MSPAYLEIKSASRRNLGLETIDLFYIHNPESQLADVTCGFSSPPERCVCSSEKLVKTGRLQYWLSCDLSAFRVADSSRDYMDLFELAKSRMKWPETIRFRFIQLPFNLAMPEAYGLVNQRFEKKDVIAVGSGAFEIAVMQRHALPGAPTQGLP